MHPQPLVLFDPHPRPINLLFDPATRARLEELGSVLWHDGSPASGEHIDRYLPETTILIGQSPLPKERLDRAPKLRAVFNVESNFLPNIDYEECQRRGIPVLSTAPVFSRPVAEMALGMALSLARRIHQADAAIRAGNETLYGEGDNHDSILLSGRPMAIIGCGNVGRALLQLLKGFGSEIFVHDPWIDPSALRELGVTPASLEECFATCTAVFLTGAVTTENAGGIGRHYFRMMARGSLVLLVSRAGVVHFDELLDEAAAGRLRVGIDVWPEEPIPADHRARTTPNTLLQAHRAGNIPEIWPMMGRMVVDDVELILKGLEPRHCQRARWETVSKLRSKPIA
ncbi:MAG: hydroxyacid dehydrogenase [Candidatus Methylacidiphilales bacterium]|nr:hydroxyacid dehydrogenase [Candidatus Methylacidiphilales bacterium]